MLYPASDLFNRLHTAIQSMPVIDCHEHVIGPEARPTRQEPIAALLVGYVQSDLYSAAAGLKLSQADIASLFDHSLPTDDKWPLFQTVWKAAQHTAYARVTLLVLQHEYGQAELTRAALERVAEQLEGRNEAWYFRTFENAGIQVMLTDALGKWSSPTRLDQFLRGEKTFPKQFLPLLPLPDFHPTQFGEAIPWVASLVNRSITSLDEFLEAVYEIFQRAIERGAIGLKDQSAYERDLSYGLPTKAEAERLFNHLLADPRHALGWPESKPLNDYLFHQYMRFGRDLDLPVQIHTGHMAGNYNRVDKTNAALLTPVLELHREVRFDLFHGNWPYLGDLLFLGKNYPNVFLNLCWLHIIDPAYAGELLERSVFTLPHSKVHAFGGDYGDSPEFIAAHLRVAREVIAGSLAHLVERGWLSEEQALQVAADWLFNNPNRFFRLGLEEISYAPEVLKIPVV